MGRALGEMFGDEMKDLLESFYSYYAGMISVLIAKKLPAFMVKGATGGSIALLHRILDLNVHITKRYTNPRYFQEIKGIGEGANGKVSARDIQRLNIFPELIKAACTVAGVWGPATSNQQTLHLRALDWDFKNPISKYPVVIVYHPSDSKLVTHANFGWAGFVGSMTGISEYVSIGEKVWLPPKNSVKMTRYGNPWTYLFRDVLYEAKNMSQALSLLTKAHRTCAIHIGIGSVADHSFRMFEYAQHTLNNYDDKNYTHYGASHPKKDGIAYFDKHVQPSNSDTCAGQVLTHVLFGLFRLTGTANGKPKVYGDALASVIRQETLNL